MPHSLLLTLLRALVSPFRPPPAAAAAPAMPPRRSRTSSAAAAPLPATFGRVSKPRTRPRTAKTAKSPALAHPKAAHPPPSPPPSPVPRSPISTQDYPSPPSPSPADALSLAFEPAAAPLAREPEYNHLLASLTRALHPDHPPIAVYVSGTPGTGKTLTVTTVLNHLHLPAVSPHRPPTSPSTVWLNCAHLAHPRDLYPAVAAALGLAPGPASAAQQAVRNFATSPGPRAILVLDEVDFLSSRDQLVLYSAFEWPHLPSSRLVVVGIANSIDLPVRLLPWLRANSCMPHLLPFAPYGSAALLAIVSQRLPERHGLSDVAVQLAAKKVAAGSGDARLVLDVCREAEMRVAEADGKSAIAVVSGIIQSRGGLSKAVDTIRQLPVQQQLALCVAANAVLLGDGKKKMKKATLGGLYESFGRMCARAKVACVSFNEFGEICCNALASHGLLDVAEPKGRGKSSTRTLRSKLVRLKAPIEDVRAGVADRGFLPLLIAR